ncbi:hypothetical protein ACWCXE_21060 [Streptomyces sp. NPDC001780]
MNRRTLPRRARAHTPGWAHPYETGPWSPVLYADGAPDDDTGPDDDGTDEDTGDDAPADDGTDDVDPDGADDLGDKGKRALDSMKTKWRTERDRRRDLEQRLAQKDDTDDSTAVRRQAETEALAKANARIVRAEVKAAAAGKLADPADAHRFLDLDQLEVDADGNVDPDEIAEAIDNLIKSKPYLAAATAKRFQGTGDGGAARKAPRPKQLSRADLKTMTPEQIVKAKADGRLNDLLGSAG